MSHLPGDRSRKGKRGKGAEANKAKLRTKKVPVAAGNIRDEEGPGRNAGAT